jgi:hypothetical protein
MAPHTTTRTVDRTALALNIPAGEAREQQLAALWAMAPAERVDAMWRGDLTLSNSRGGARGPSTRYRCSAASSRGS